MDKGILNQSLLEKNIEQIKFYSLEEKQILNKIDKELNEGSKNYNSTNTALFLNNVGNFKNNIDFIYEKRIRYTTVLNEMIVKYNELSIATRQIFDKEVQ